MKRISDRKCQNYKKEHLKFIGGNVTGEKNLT